MLKKKFYLNFFLVSKVASLRIDVLTFKQLEKESLGAAWAHFKEISAVGPDLGLSEPILLQHFYLGLSPTAMTFHNSASGGSFNRLTPSEGKKSWMRY